MRTRNRKSSLNLHPYTVLLAWPDGSTYMGHVEADGIRQAIGTARRMAGVNTPSLDWSVADLEPLAVFSGHLYDELDSLT